jgi:hypothetical protein
MPYEDNHAAFQRKDVSMNPRSAFGFLLIDIRLFMSLHVPRDSLGCALMPIADQCRVPADGSAANRTSLNNKMFAPDVAQEHFDCRGGDWGRFSSNTFRCHRVDRTICSQCGLPKNTDQLPQSCCLRQREHVQCMALRTRFDFRRHVARHLPRAAATLARGNDNILLPVHTER